MGDLVGFAPCSRGSRPSRSIRFALCARWVTPIPASFAARDQYARQLNNVAGSQYTLSANGGAPTRLRCLISQPPIHGRAIDLVWLRDIRHRYGRVHVPSQLSDPGRPRPSLATHASVPDSPWRSTAIRSAWSVGRSACLACLACC
jgi:hypothetical protein